MTLTCQRIFDGHACGAPATCLYRSQWNTRVFCDECAAYYAHEARAPKGGQARLNIVPLPLCFHCGNVASHYYVTGALQYPVCEVIGGEGAAPVGEGVGVVTDKLFDPHRTPVAMLETLAGLRQQVADLSRPTGHWKPTFLQRLAAWWRRRFMGTGDWTAKALRERRQIKPPPLS